jgi:hypothetical protein
VSATANETNVSDTITILVETEGMSFVPASPTVSRKQQPAVLSCDVMLHPHAKKRVLQSDGLPRKGEAISSLSALVVTYSMLNKIASQVKMWRMLTKKSTLPSQVSASTINNGSIHVFNIDMYLTLIQILSSM